MTPFRLPASEAAWWVARQARYRIAYALGLSPYGRDDPAITGIAATLTHQPATEQARILRSAAALLYKPLGFPS